MSRWQVRSAWLVIVASSAAIVVLVLIQRSDETLTEVREDAMAAAERLVPEVLSYDHADLDGYRQRAAQATTGQFRTELLDLIDTELSEVASRDRIAKRATMPASSVMEASPREVMLLVFVNQVTREGDGTPELEASRVRVTLVLDDDQWRIRALDPI